MQTLVRKFREHPITVRVLLVPLFVGLCYCSQWHWLRELTVTIILALSALLGLPMQRLSADVIGMGGISARFEVACTLIDACFGAIPLLWKPGFSFLRNLQRLVMLLPVAFLLNICRLEIGFVAFAKGAPWWVAHECVAGVTYFFLYLFILHQHTWEEPAPRYPARPITLTTSRY